MAQIFISYSRADAQFINDLVPLLHEAYGVASVFYDEQIPGGTKWWEMILGEIAACDLFIYLCSNDSLHSPYCQSELREAVRLQKQVLPVIVRPKTNYPFAGVDYGTAIPDDVADILRDTNCIDLSKGFRDRDSGSRASAKLYGGIYIALKKASSTSQPPLTPTPTAQPQVNYKKKRSWLNEPRAIIIAALITGMFAIGGVVLPLIVNDQNAQQMQDIPTQDISPSPTTQEIAEASTLPSETPSPTILSSDTSEPSATAIATSTTTTPPTATVDAAATQAAELQLSLTALAAEQAMAMTQSVLDRAATEQALDVTRTRESEIAVRDVTATAEAWTSTPTPTPSATPNPLPSSAFSPTPNPRSDPIELARIPVIRNVDWTPIERSINGTVMVLVPSGCFLMGSSSGESDEVPVGEVCFESPFWIDKFEVTNEQYGSIGCSEWSSQPNQPRNCITWPEALDYCESRGTRLPSEAEWEYAARGPDALTFPWGNEYMASSAIDVNDPTFGLTRPNIVGSRPNGASWVGALDMSGNLWEWTSSLNRPYPYVASDGREDLSDTLRNSRRIMRGGSYWDSIGNLRLPNRFANLPEQDVRLVGIRCVMSS